MSPGPRRSRAFPERDQELLHAVLVDRVVLAHPSHRQCSAERLRQNPQLWPSPASSTSTRQSTTSSRRRASTSTSGPGRIGRPAVQQHQPVTFSPLASST